MSGHFNRELLKIVVAQITQGLGFQAIHRSACESLTDILELYIDELGFLSHNYSEHACRTEVNFHDLKLSFDDLGVSLNDLQVFATHAEEIPFAKPIPKFPHSHDSNTSASESTIPNGKEDVDGNNEEVNSKKLLSEDLSTSLFPAHVPSFLTPFPDRHTYIRTPIFDEHITDPKLIRRTRNKQRRQVEQSLIKLSSQMHTKPVQDYESVKQKEGAKSRNPYLATPHAPSSSSSSSSSSRPKVTPILDPSLFASYVTERETDGRGNKFDWEDEERNTRRIDGMEDSERTRKRQKVLNILSLEHKDGIPESLDAAAREAREHGAAHTTTPAAAAAHPPFPSAPQGGVQSRSVSRKLSSIYLFETANKWKRS